MAAKFYYHWYYYKSSDSNHTTCLYRFTLQLLIVCLYDRWFLLKHTDPETICEVNESRALWIHNNEHSMKVEFYYDCYYQKLIPLIQNLELVFADRLSNRLFVYDRIKRVSVNHEPSQFLCKREGSPLQVFWSTCDKRANEHFLTFEDLQRNTKKETT